MNPSATALFIPCLTFCAACVDTDFSEPTGVRTQAVIDGEEQPESLGFTMFPLQKNAVVAQQANAGGKKYQGCTSTLAGDRVVVSAGHCVVQNQEKWLKGEEPPQVVPINQLSYAVGPDVNHPLCTLEVESVHLHPDIKSSTTYGIENDVSVSILKASVFDSCPQVIPISINSEDISQGLTGESLLQGGYGSLDGTYDFSPLRYWSKIELVELDQKAIIAKDIQLGFPTYGDSGSAALYPFPDGTLRNLGVATGGQDGIMFFTRLDTQAAFFSSAIDEQLTCGPALGTGTCVENVHVICVKGSFSLNDCAVEGMECGLDEQGASGCLCTCDQQPYCDTDCACDVDCACECDLSAGCDQGCDCDAACQGNALDGGAADTAPRNADTKITGQDEPSGCNLAGRSTSPGILFWLIILACLRSRAARVPLRGSLGLVRFG